MQINLNDTVMSALTSAAQLANTTTEQFVVDLVTKHVVKSEIAKTKARLRDLKATSGGEVLSGRSKAVLAVFEQQPQSTFRVADIVAAIPGSNIQYNGRVLTALFKEGKIKRVGHGEYQLA